MIYHEMVNRVMSSLVDARTLLQKPDRPVAVAMHAVLNAKQQDCTAVIWSYTCLAVALPPCAPERHRLDRASPRPLFLPDKGRNTASKSRRVRSHSSLSTSAVVREAKAARTPTRAARTLTTQRQARCPSSIHLFSTSAVWHKANPASILVCRLSSAGHVPLPSAHQGPSQQASKARKRPWRLSRRRRRRRRRDVRKEADRSSGIFCNPCDDGNRPGPPCLDYLPYEGGPEAWERERSLRPKISHASFLCPPDLLDSSVPNRAFPCSRHACGAPDLCESAFGGKTAMPSGVVRVTPGVHVDLGSPSSQLTVSSLVYLVAKETHISRKSGIHSVPTI